MNDATSFSPEKVQVQAQSIGVPVGTVIVWTKNAVPDGWLECNGQKVNKALYPDLAALMPNVPNYQGMFLRGAGTQAINHGGYGWAYHGTTLGQVQGDTTRDWFFQQLNPGGYGSYEGIGTATSDRQPGPDGGGGAWNSAIYRPSKMVPTANENRPVNVGVKYIIKAE